MASIRVDAPLCIAAGAIFPPRCTFVVVLRFCTRKQKGNSFGLDDWLTVPALLIEVGMCIAMLIGVGWHAIGYPAPPLPPGTTILTAQSQKQTRIRSILWAIEVMNIPALTAIKLSFLIFYHRVFYKGSSLGYRKVLILMMTMVAIWGVAYFFTFLFICPGTPNAYWTTLAEEKQKCINTAVVHNSYSTSNFLLDWIIIVLPVVPVWRLQLTLQKRMGLLGVFLLGSFTIIASAIRMVTYWQASAALFKPHSDIDTLVTGVMYWTVVECGIALISCCLPLCSGLLRGNNIFKSKDEYDPNTSPLAAKFPPSTARQSVCIDSDTHSDEDLVRPDPISKSEVEDARRIHVTKTFEVSELSRL